MRARMMWTCITPAVHTIISCSSRFSRLLASYKQLIVIVYVCWIDSVIHLLLLSDIELERSMAMHAGARSHRAPRSVAAHMCK